MLCVTREGEGRERGRERGGRGEGEGRERGGRGGGGMGERYMEERGKESR